MADSHEDLLALSASMRAESQEMVRNALNEVKNIVAPMLTQAQAENQTALLDLNNRALQEIKEQVQTVKNTLQAHQAEIAGMVQAETDKKFDVANEAFKKEKTDTRESLQKVQEAISRVGDGELLQRFVNDLATLEKTQEQQLIAAHTLLKQDVRELDGRFDGRLNSFGQETVQRLTQLKGFPVVPPRSPGFDPPQWGR